MLIIVPADYRNGLPLFRALDAYGQSTDVVFADMRRNSEGVAVFVDNGCITMIAKYRTGTKVATNRTRIRFMEPRMFSEQFVIDSVTDLLPKYRHRVAIALDSSELSFLPPATASAIWGALVQLRPEFKGYFEPSLPRAYIPETYSVQRLEYDAITLPLKMAGLDEVAFDMSDTNRTIFDQIVYGEMLEDQMLTHDYGVLSDPRTWGSDFSGRAFTVPSTGAVVTVWYANRANLEHLLGVDLILYHSVHKSFLLIQYKKMKVESDEHVYRLDHQLDVEIERMEQVVRETVTSDGSRLHPNPFFLRFCWERQDMGCHGRFELLKGMNLPLEYFTYLRQSDRFRTKRGAEVLDKESVGRYLDNTHLIDLFKNGWIGSASITSDQISHFVQEQLGKKHSIVVAMV